MSWTCTSKEKQEGVEIAGGGSQLPSRGSPGGFRRRSLAET